MHGIAEHDHSLSFSRVQGPEPAVPVVAVALPGGGRAEPAGLELGDRGRELGEPGGGDKTMHLLPFSMLSRRPLSKSS